MDIREYFQQGFPACLSTQFDQPLAVSGHEPCVTRLHLTVMPPLVRFVSLYCGQSREQLSSAAIPFADHLPTLLSTMLQEGVVYPPVTPVFIYTTFDVDDRLAAYVKSRLGVDFEVYFRTPVYAQNRDQQEAIIKTFLKKYTSVHFRSFELVTAAIRKQLESEFKNQNILAWVSSRTKAPDSLSQKLWKRALAPDGSLRKTYQTEDDIFADLADLSGLRIALYFPGDRHIATELINGMYKCLEVKSFPEDAVKPNFEKRFSGYWAQHARIIVTGKEVGLDAMLEAREFRCEIQIGSVIMHAWSEVEHDILYKQQKGVPSAIEAQLLDELNGLAIAGEIILEHLQLVYRQRMQQLEERIARAKAKNAS